MAKLNIKYSLNYQIFGRDIRVFRLEPSYTNQKSFYGKAVVIKDSNGNKYLQSYNTVVCAIDKQGNFYRLWDGYSVSTMNHINDFLYQNDIDGGGKKWWQSLKVVSASDFIQENTTAKKAA